MANNINDVLDAQGIRIIQRDVGRGGSAVVHKGESTRAGATLPDPGTPIAVKEYLPSILGNPGQVERIQQEATLGRQLNHENVVRTYDLLGPEAGLESTYLLLLEWIDGDTLEGWYAAQSSPPVWEVVQRICLDIVDGLDELHSREIFHRDIKPENIMVRRSGRAVLMDIGVAEPTADTEHSMHTSMKDFLGSTRYASPQFILGEMPFVAADDVYSVGATFHLLFTGRQIFADVTRKPVIPIIAVTNPPQVVSLSDSIPAPMRVLLEACLHRDRARRPKLHELREALQSPEGSKFISAEIERQSAEARAYTILKVDQEGSFFADLAGDSPELDETYTVVRRGAHVFVPSYNRDVVSEEWVGEAVLKHVHMNLGYFAVLERKWQESRSRASMFALPPTGQWVEQEARQLRVRAGDLVLRKRDST